jgi:hypothetical protein
LDPPSKGVQLETVSSELPSGVKQYRVDLVDGGKVPATKSSTCTTIGATDGSDTFSTGHRIFSSTNSELSATRPEDNIPTTASANP